MLTYTVPTSCLPLILGESVQIVVLEIKKLVIQPLNNVAAKPSSPLAPRQRCCRTPHLPCHSPTSPFTLSSVIIVAAAAPHRQMLALQRRRTLCK
ncbi:uncharacterized protein LOC121236978 isoform X5 [Juglans microcarpa x Juglans regia]|uniref:uncharacterized protein LOC121236978 isoform X5 n=1 Tax=Juglans microcarpa x Juglans regia TaxID=2249226 RepID=UPI001B7E3519|nr:uncharacterized protein LOC121236978 isoform X5 [Juglans microcarpa x Juglans regia]